MRSVGGEGGDGVGEGLRAGEEGVVGFAGDLDETGVGQGLVQAAGDVGQPAGTEFADHEEGRDGEGGEAGEVVAEAVHRAHLAGPRRGHGRADGPERGLAELLDRLVGELQEVPQPEGEGLVEVAGLDGLLERGESVAADRAAQRDRRLVEDERRRGLVQGVGEGDQPAVGVAEQDRVRTGEVENGRDVVGLPLDGVLAVVTAGAPAAAVDRVGGEMRSQQVGEELPVLGRVEGARGNDQGGPAR